MTHCLSPESTKGIRGSFIQILYNVEENFTVGSTDQVLNKLLFKRKKLKIEYNSVRSNLRIFSTTFTFLT